MIQYVLLTHDMIGGLTVSWGGKAVTAAGGVYSLCWLSVHGGKTDGIDPERLDYSVV